MIYRGQVRQGVIVLDDHVGLPEGTVVEVQPVRADSPETGETAIPTLYDRLKGFVGAVSGLPPDLAQNHDHYLHGAPKKA